MTENEDDASEWSDAQILNRALLQVSVENPEHSILIGVVEYAGACECCDAMLIECFDVETESLFEKGTALNLRLSQLVEKPIDIGGREHV